MNAKDEPLKVLFLDIDGVLAGAWLWEKLEAEKVPFEQRMHALCPDAMARLNRVIDATGAQVVISSTWRRIMSRGEIWRRMRAAGFKYRLLDMTPVDRGCQWHTGKCSDGHRGGEIQNWLDDECHQSGPVTKFAIVDDDSDMGPLKDRLVKTQNWVGLQDEHVDRLIALLQ